MNRAPLNIASLNKRQCAQSKATDRKIAIMKTILTVISSLAVLGTALPSASAGDREWATAGKVLTGVAIGSVLARAFEAPPVYHTTTVYSAPVVVHSAPAYVPPPPAVVYRPHVVVHQPVVVHHPPVYVTPPPVYVRAVPVCPPPPRVRVQIGFGRPYCPPPVFRACW
jgi:hypothetical protein